MSSATSVGANYEEADGAESKKDFQHKIGICRKEAKETKYWKCITLWKEAQELTLIFSAILLSSKKKVI
jgi:four helix bundle protein